MYRRFLSLIAFAVVGTLASLPVRADDDEAIKKEFQTMYDKAAMVFQSRSADAYASKLAPGFKNISLLGKEQTADEWMTALKAQLTAFKPANASILLRSLTVKDTEATAVIQSKYDGILTDDEGKENKYSSNHYLRHVWVKADGGWKLKTQALLMEENRKNGLRTPPRANVESETARDAIQQIYEAMEKVYNSKDVAALEKGVPQDFVGKAQDGTPLDRKQFIERIKISLALQTNPNISIIIYQIEATGDNAVVVRLQRLTSEISLPTGTKGKLTHFGTYRDKWTKTPKGWTSKDSEELYAETMLDGKPFPPGK